MLSHVLHTSPGMIFHPSQCRALPVGCRGLGGQVPAGILHSRESTTGTKPAPHEVGRRCSSLQPAQALLAFCGYFLGVFGALRV